MNAEKKYFIYNSMQSFFIRKDNWAKDTVPELLESNAKLSGYRLALSKWGFVMAVESRPSDTIYGSIMKFNCPTTHRTMVATMLNAGFKYVELGMYGTFVVGESSTLLKDSYPIDGGNYTKVYGNGDIISRMTKAPYLEVEAAAAEPLD